MLKTLKEFFNSTMSHVDTQAVIAEIHNEFDTASDKLLAEAKNILASDLNVEKGEKLKKLGFRNSKPAIDADTVNFWRNEAIEAKKWIDYYGQHYPFNKFITVFLVGQICEKYRLVCGDADIYRGDVPAKNVLEIEAFKLRAQDTHKYLIENMTRVRETNFMICAPEKDFDMTNHIRKGNRIVVKEIPDPIVLQPVDGGFLVVSKWGLEAEDELLVNEKMN